MAHPLQSVELLLVLLFPADPPQRAPDSGPRGVGVFFREKEPPSGDYRPPQRCLGGFWWREVPRERPSANLGPPTQADVASHLINVAALKGGHDNQAYPPSAEFPSRT